MEFEADVTLKVATLLLGLIGIGKVIYDVSIGKRGRMREEYTFAKGFLQELKEQRGMHHYAREKGFQAIAGNDRLSSKEVEYLLSLEGADRALKDYVLGRHYLEHLPDQGNLEIAFKKKYRRPWARSWRKWMYLIFYVVLAFAAFLPLLFFKEWFNSPWGAMLVFAFTLTVFGSYAWFAMKAAVRIHRAEKLVENQSKHPEHALIGRPDFVKYTSRRN